MSEETDRLLRELRFHLTEEWEKKRVRERRLINRCGGRLDELRAFVSAMQEPILEATMRQVAVHSSPYEFDWENDAVLTAYRFEGGGAPDLILSFRVREADMALDQADDTFQAPEYIYSVVAHMALAHYKP